jgi:hypothetical protein
MLPWLILVAVAALIAWLAVRPGDCVIRVRSGIVSVRGKCTSGRVGEIESYFRQHFARVGKLRVDIEFSTRTRPVKVRVRGPISRGEQQMIRNFLLTMF